MNYLKIIFYGILSFIERNPIFCLFFLIIAIVAPFLVKVFLYVILAILLLALIGIGVAVWRMRKMQRQMEEQFRNMGSQQNFGGANPFGGGFAGFSNMGGMTLEELVHQMQAQADAQQRAKQSAGSQQRDNSTAETTTSGQTRKRVSDDVGDYVDFEEVKEK